MKHSYYAIPNRESLARSPARTTIDLHIVLRPHCENTLIDALYKGFFFKTFFKPGQYIIQDRA